MAKSIGIDLGTTNSVAAIKKVQTRVLNNAEGEPVTPSCVTLVGIAAGGAELGSSRPCGALRDEAAELGSSRPCGALRDEAAEFVVGRDALQWRKQEPQSTVVAVKRLMGRSIQDEAVRQIIDEARLGYAIGPHPRGTENSLAILLRGHPFTPEQISAEILKKIRADAAAALEDEVDYAVITVPAYFNDKQKHATRTAAALAGLRVRRLLPEPTSAAISFGVDEVHGDETRTILVLDFGGGTFDLSVLTISGGQMIEQGKGGDMWLGGEEIDQLIADRVLGETAREHRITDIRALVDALEPRLRSRFQGELRSQAEQAKVRLSSRSAASVEIVGLLRDEEGDPIDVCVELTREQLEALIAPVIQRAIGLCRSLIEEIDLTPELIDKVLLVGGSAQIPAFIAAVRAELGQDRVLVHPRPMLAVAEGAAILSHRLADAYECPGCGRTVAQADAACLGCGFDLERFTIEQGVLDIVHSAAHDYYIRLENDEQHRLVEKNTPLPCRVTEELELLHARQRLAHLKFFNVVNGAHESIGDLWLGIGSQPRSRNTADATPPRVVMTLSIDENNLIEVTAALRDDPEVRLSRALSRGKADEKLYRALEQAIVDANRQGYDGYRMTDIELRALSAIADINRVVDADTGVVDEALYARAALKIEKSLKMAAADQASAPTICYGEHALARFGFAISPEKQAAIRAAIDHLRRMDEEGSVDDNLAACDDLHRTLSDLGMVNVLMEIEKAGNLCAQRDPRRAERFYGALDRIMQAFADGEEDRAVALAREALDETRGILQAEQAQAGVIHKDLRQRGDAVPDESR